MKIAALILILGFTPLTAQSECAEGYAPKVHKSKFEITKIESAKLKCDWDDLGHKIDPVGYIPEKGCYLDLKNIGPKEIVQEPRAKNTVSVYVFGQLCERKVGEKLDLSVGPPLCCEGEAFYTCEKKKTLTVKGKRSFAPFEMQCLSQRWIVVGQFYPRNN